ncbi:hypothetical protein CDD81_1453 [Ophiocordyceps australis]|uniref:NAD dependent epimerase/dehydratase n=1 Tax=Ophiocordyceps australis TaxID=1399860 RepID=A0A2C5YDE7_9HYPO|nr:hypothetical protein CDD81_1453 [Ophiocordyceps australis]
MDIDSRPFPPGGVQKRAVPMRVIVCGVHRTGTMSMRTALHQLGFHDCYHFFAVMENLDDHPQQWARALKAKQNGTTPLTKAEWDLLLGHSQACCDVPAVLFSVELAQMYPEAKVVILNRDPEAWYQSALNTVHVAVNPTSLLERLTALYCYFFDSKTRNYSIFAKILFHDYIDHDLAQEKEKAISWFKALYQDFRTQIPAERRIEYRIQDGWGPLCKHLGVQVPTIEDAAGNLVEAPFPRINDREEFSARRILFARQALQRANRNALALVGKLTLVGGLAYGGLWLWKFLGRMDLASKFFLI